MIAPNEARLSSIQGLEKDIAELTIALDMSIRAPEKFFLSKYITARPSNALLQLGSMTSAILNRSCAYWGH